MQYTDSYGSTQQADLWSPGPLPHTVWVLTDSGCAVVVDARTRRETSYNAPDLAGFQQSLRILTRQAEYIHKRGMRAAVPLKVWQQLVDAEISAQQEPLFDVAAA